MRILFITESCVSGGAARYVRELSASLNARGHLATVLANKTTAESHHIPLCRSSVERILAPLELLPNWTDFRHFASRRKFSAIPKHAFDVVHLNQISGGWLSMGALKKLTSRFPTVWTHHDEWGVTEGISCPLEGKISRTAALRDASLPRRLIGLSPHHSTFKSRSLGHLIDRNCPRVDVHVSPSVHIYEKIRAHPRYRGTKVRLIRNATTLLDEPMIGIDRQEARRRLGIAEDAQLVLMVSVNLGDVHKGLVQGLDGLRRLTATHPRLSLVLLGRADPAIGSAIGSIPHVIREAKTSSDLALYYRAADVTLIPSLADNFPYVAIESLACMTPFVAFRMGGPKEIANEESNGLLADCFDPQGLADRVHNLLSDARLREQLGASGHAWVRQHCNSNDMLDSVEQAYQDAIAIFKVR